MNLYGISIEYSWGAHFTTRFGNCLLRLLILCKMGCKLTSALQWFWFCLLLFLTKNHLSYPITGSLSIQTPWLSNPLFLHCPWSLFHSALSAAYDLGSLNLMTNWYKVQVFKYYYFVFVLAEFFSEEGQKHRSDPQSFSYRLLLLLKIQKATASQQYDCKEIFTTANMTFFIHWLILYFSQLELEKEERFFFLISSPRSISSIGDKYI